MGHHYCVDRHVRTSDHSSTRFGVTSWRVPSLDKLVVIGGLTRLETHRVKASRSSGKFKQEFWGTMYRKTLYYFFRAYECSSFCIFFFQKNYWGILWWTIHFFIKGGLFLGRIHHSYYLCATKTFIKSVLICGLSFVSLMEIRPLTKKTRRAPPGS